MGISNLIVFRCGLFLVLLIFCSLAGSESEVVTIDVHQAKNLVDSGYRYLDVRTLEEYKKGHVSAEKIINIPYMFNTLEGRVKNPEFLKEVSSLCKEGDPLVVGCQTGVRSLYATADLLTIGFKNVSNMGGGYLAWVGNGLLASGMEEKAEANHGHRVDSCPFRCGREANKRVLTAAALFNIKEGNCPSGV
ncbi:hypothetical protein SLA2020_134630 [Shorea laevis]